MSIRIICFSESNSDEASDLANSVLPTPVGPKNKKLPIGRLGSFIPHVLSLQHLTQDLPLYLALRHVHVRYHLSLIIFLSVSTNLETGIPVHWLTISPISSSETTSRIMRSLSPCSSWKASSYSFNSFLIVESYHIVILPLFHNYFLFAHLLKLDDYDLIQHVFLELSRFFFSCSTRDCNDVCFSFHLKVLLVILLIDVYLHYLIHFSMHFLQFLIA